MNTNDITSDAFSALVIARLTSAGKTTDWATVCATMLAMTAHLQASYKGRLQEMVPRTGGNAMGDASRRLKVYTWMVMDVCKKHSRTAQQVMDALDVVLAGAVEVEPAI